MSNIESPEWKAQRMRDLEVDAESSGGAEDDGADAASVGAGAASAGAASAGAASAGAASAGAASAGAESGSAGAGQRCESPRGYFSSRSLPFKRNSLTPKMAPPPPPPSMAVPPPSMPALFVLDNDMEDDAIPADSASTAASASAFDSDSEASDASDASAESPSPPPSPSPSSSPPPPPPSATEYDAPNNEPLFNEAVYTSEESTLLSEEANPRYVTLPNEVKTPPRNDASFGAASGATSSPKTTPILKKKKTMAPPPPPASNDAASVVDVQTTAYKSLARLEESVDPSLDIDKPRPYGGGGGRGGRGGGGGGGTIQSTLDRRAYHDDVDSEFQFRSLSRAPSEASSFDAQRYLRFRKVTFKEFSQRGFLVPTWYVGILQMTVGIAAAILAITEILLPTGSDTHGTSDMFTLKVDMFTLKEYNIYGCSFISSVSLMVAGCYLVRAQAKNDLYAIKGSAGYAAVSTIFHMATLLARFYCLWTGKIAPSTIGVNMYIASLCILILTLFGFWFSALGFGVYSLYVVNHVQEVYTPEDLHKESRPVLDLLDRYMGVTR